MIWEMKKKCRRIKVESREIAAFHLLSVWFKKGDFIPSQKIDLKKLRF
jgi:hypothetical protein